MTLEEYRAQSKVMEQAEKIIKRNEQIQAALDTLTTEGYDVDTIRRVCEVIMDINTYSRNAQTAALFNVLDTCLQYELESNWKDMSEL